MTTNHVYVLHADMGSGELRHVVHLCEGPEGLQDHIVDFMDAANRPAPTMAQNMALAAGPHHPAFKPTLEALRLTHSIGCSQSIVRRATEMLIAAEMIPPASEGDDMLMQALYGSFAVEDDWEAFTHSSQNAAINFLLAHDAIGDPSDELPVTQRMLIVQLSSAICVAMVQARAELQRELTAQSADSDG